MGFWLGSKSLLQRCLALELFFFLHLYMRLFYLSGLIGIERCLEASLSVFSSRSKRLQPDLEQFRLLSCMCLYPDREKAPWEKAGNYLASSLVFGRGPCLQPVVLQSSDGIYPGYSNRYTNPLVVAFGCHSLFRSFFRTTSHVVRTP